MNFTMDGGNSVMLSPIALGAAVSSFEHSSWLLWYSGNDCPGRRGH